MSWFKFSIVFALFSTQLYATQFSDMDCIKGNFSTEVTHKGQPFGLTQNILNLQKEQCVFRISHEKLKVMKKHWVVDVCREPVHIKQGTGAVEILKREGSCADGENSSYCKTVKNITKIIQDDGLIFAKGEKEDLRSEHGKVYCTYLLMKSYLSRGMVFSRHKHYANVLDPQKAKRVMEPAVQDQVETKASSGSKGLFDF